MNERHTCMHEKESFTWDDCHIIMVRGKCYMQTYLSSIHVKTCPLYVCIIRHSSCELSLIILKWGLWTKLAIKWAKISNIWGHILVEWFFWLVEWEDVHIFSMLQDPIIDFKNLNIWILGHECIHHGRDDGLHKVVDKHFVPKPPNKRLVSLI